MKVKNLKKLLIISIIFYSVCIYFQNLSCGRELASLLISLYPVCLQKLGPEQKKIVKVENPFITFSKDSCNMDSIPR
jgi:hypothetical protein